MSAALDYEQAGELKIGQVGIANLRIRTLDVARLVDEMRGRVQRAPKLFARAAVVLDFGGLTPDARRRHRARALIDGLREAGVLPVALAYGTSETERLAEALGLPLLAKFRAQYERADERRHRAASLPHRRAAKPRRRSARESRRRPQRRRRRQSGHDAVRAGALGPAGLRREPRPDRAAPRSAPARK